MTGLNFSLKVSCKIAENKARSTLYIMAELYPSFRHHNKIFVRTGPYQNLYFPAQQIPAIQKPLNLPTSFHPPNQRFFAAVYSMPRLHFFEPEDYCKIFPVRRSWSFDALNCFHS